MKRARFVAEAREEFLAEVVYYNEAQPGLGDHFTKAVEEATARALTSRYQGHHQLQIRGAFFSKGFLSRFSTGKRAKA